MDGPLVRSALTECGQEASSVDPCQSFAASDAPPAPLLGSGGVARHHPVPSYELDHTRGLAINASAR
jgi:hypothetical protein